MFSSLQLDGSANGRGGRGGGVRREHLLSGDQKKGVLGQQSYAFHILQPVNSKAVPQFSWVGIEINEEESSVAYTLTLSV